jgi:RNA polymerase sigma-70 factor (ECF subfamily)
MTDCYQNGCVSEIAWLTNDELGALIAGVVLHERGASNRLFTAVAPLLMAFYEGQVQAGRARQEHLEGLVHEALMTVYQRCPHYDRAHPTRAWLIEIARCKLLEYIQSNRECTSVLLPTASSITSAHMASKTV